MGESERRRTRLPGKYIVLFLFAPVALVAVAAGVWLNGAERRAAFAALDFRQAEDGAREAYFALDPFLIDLAAGESGDQRYLKLEASIALRGEHVAATAASIETRLPHLRERLSFFLRALRASDLEGSDGMARLKEEMVRRVNLSIAPAVAHDVVIESIIIQ